MVLTQIQYITTTYNLEDIEFITVSDAKIYTDVYKNVTFLNDIELVKAESHDGNETVYWDYADIISIGFSKDKSDWTFGD